MLTKEEFLLKYRNEDKFIKSGLNWDELVKIALDHEKDHLNLQNLGEGVLKTLSPVEEIHSLKTRVKDPEHLIEKIIRKKAENAAIDIGFENYKTVIKDLVGVRVIHLFKEDWLKIHNFIMSNFNIIDKPTANIREGDLKEYVEDFRKNGCDIKTHNFGYRSIHYTINQSLTNKTSFLEIQVRTIFEEGWSEIDHKFRYPYEVDNPLLNQYLLLFNRLAGTVDEMGTFVIDLKKEIDQFDNFNSKILDYTKQLKDEKSRKTDQTENIKTFINLITAFSSILPIVSTVATMTSLLSSVEDVKKSIEPKMLESKTQNQSNPSEISDLIKGIKKDLTNEKSDKSDEKEQKRKPKDSKK